MKMRKLRINPGAVCRQLLTNLKTYKPLTEDEVRRLIHAVERTGISREKWLAHLSRRTEYD